MPDADGYPTEQELERIRSWDMGDPLGWLEFCRSCWWNADWGWKELAHASTGGWSGNEDIIDAMYEAQQGMLWHQVWESTRRGGHYTFDVAAIRAGRPPTERTAQ